MHAAGRSGLEANDLELLRGPRCRRALRLAGARVPARIERGMLGCAERSRAYQGRASSGELVHEGRTATVALSSPRGGSMGRRPSRARPPMSGNAPLDALPLWAIFAATIAMIVLANECGYRLGQARSRQKDRESESPVGGMVGAELGLLAFLLAFTFGIAATRFDTRREVVLAEANAIGTAYLRAAMLPEPHRAEVRRLLRDYTDVRIGAREGASLEGAIHRSEELHGRLWAEAVSAAEKDPRSVPVGLFIQAVNDVIDVHTKRLTASVRSRIPIAVWVVLYGVAILAFIAMGYHVGLVRTSRSPGIVAVALTFAAVMWLVVDLDRPAEGWLTVNQQAMIDVRHSMDATKP